MQIYYYCSMHGMPLVKTTIEFLLIINSISFLRLYINLLFSGENIKIYRFISS